MPRRTTEPRRVQDAERRAARAELVAELFRAAARLTDERELLDLMARRIAGGLGDSVSTFVLTPDRKWLERTMTHALDPRQAALLVESGRRRMRAGTGVAGRVVATGRPLLLTSVAEYADSQLSPEDATLARSLGINSLLAAPLIVHDRVFGVIEVARTGRNREPFTEEDAAFLTQLTGNASAFSVVGDRLERDRVMRERVRQRERDHVVAEFFAATAEIDDEEQVLQDLAARAAHELAARCLILRAAPDRESLELVALAGDPDAEALRERYRRERLGTQEAITGKAFTTGRPQFEPLLSAAARRAHVRTMSDRTLPLYGGTPPTGVIAVPLSIRNVVAGVLTVGRHDERPFEQADLEFAVALASRAAIGLERIRERTERDREARRAQVITDFVQSASDAPDERAVLEQLAQRASDAVDGSLGVYRITPDGRELEAVALRSHDAVADAFREMYAVQRWRVGEGVMGRALRAGETVFLPYMSAPEREAYLASLPEDRRPAMADRDLRGIIAIPLSVRGRQMGILTLARYGPDAAPFTEQDRTFAEDLAGRANIALTRLALEAERDREARLVRVLAGFLEGVTEANGDENTILDRLADAAAAELGDVCVIRLAGPPGTAGGRRGATADAATGAATGNADGGGGTADRAGEIDAAEIGAIAARDARLADELVASWSRTSLAKLGLAGPGQTPTHEATPGGPDVAHRRPVLARIDAGGGPFADLAAAGYGSLVAAPLRAHGDVIGEIVLLRQRTSAPFDNRDLVFLEDLAQRASLAVGRHRAERALAESAARFETLLNQSPIPTVLFGRDGRIELWNPAAEELFGWTAAEVIGLTRNPWVPPEALAEAEEFDRRGQAGENIRAVEVRRRRKDGSLVDLLFYQAPIHTMGGDIHGFVVRVVDITERKQLERELRGTSETLHAILDASPLAIVTSDVDRHITYWNRAAEQLYGWTADEVMGQWPPQIIPGEPDLFRPLLPRLLAGETITLDHVRRRTKSGEVIELRMSGAPVFGANGEVVGMLGIHEDLRSLRTLQRELERTSATLRTILDSSPLPVIAVDEEMRVTFWSHAAETLYGWSEAELLGRTPPIAPPDDPGILEATFERVRHGEIVSGETRRATRSGRVLDVSTHTGPLRDEFGGIRGALAVDEDIAGRKQLEAELLQAQKMETVGRLAGGVAHDFNNILTAIIGYTDIARTAVSPTDVELALSTIRTAAERAAGLTQQLLAFSRRQMLQPQIVETNEVVLGLESILRRLIGEDVELVTAVTPHAGSILVDHTQLEQVILNLAVNARDAMPDGGRLVLRTEVAQLTADHSHIEMPPGDYVVISVTDTGTGMDEATKARIFEPFFTTKEVGKGTGLGLATTYGIVRQSGGYIWVYSEVGRGTTFKLYFPRVGGKAPSEPEVARQRGERRGRVLLVEDEPVLRDLARLVLVRDGFEVVHAPDPVRALSMAEADASFDLLVTDVVMPKMTGVELARQLRAMRPGLRVLLMSGYAQDVADADDLSTSFLSKPFTPETLLRAVDQALAEGDEAVADRGDPAR